MRTDKSNIVVSAIWYERFLECSRTYGTVEYPRSVWRFYHSLVNLNHDDLKIKIMVKDYVVNVWQPKIFNIVRARTYTTNDPDVLHSEQKLVEAENIDEVFDFIIQSIQDSGIGWHTSDNIQGFHISQE